MKTLIIAFKLMFIPLILVAQIDYRQQMDYISTKDSVVRVDWILRSPEKCQLDFNHYIEFLNTQNDSDYGSMVLVEIYHNDKFVRDYRFKTGEDYTNRIYLHKPLKLKEGDNVYFVMKLTDFGNGEEYVFNIYQDKKIYANKQNVVASSITHTKKVTTPVKSKSVKNNGIDKNFRRMQRRPIENERN